MVTAMSKAIRASVLLILVVLVSMVVTACGSTTVTDNGDKSNVSQLSEGMILHAADATADIDKVERDFAEIKSHRHVSEGWASEVRPGDTRGMNEISKDLAMMDLIDGRLFKLGTSDRVFNLQVEVREAMIDDLKFLLKIADRDLDINAIGRFLEYAPKLDTSLENDFGTNAKDLRAKALAMARNETSELRPRIHKGSADAIGVVNSILQEWQFTPEELGLTAADMKSISGH